MSLLHRVLGLAALLALAGCATTVPLQRGQVDALTRESAPAVVEQALGKATPTAAFELTAEGNPHFVRRYLLQTGARQEMTMVCTTFCFPVFFDVPIMMDYVLVQRLPSKAMHAWGSVEELSKDQDAAVSNMMPALKARLEIIDAQKKK